MNREDLAWAAGFYEGEGHMTHRTGNGGPLIKISQVNREPLLKMQSIFGGKIYGPYSNGSNPKWNDHYSWELTKHSEARACFYKISFWLSESRLNDGLGKIEAYQDKLSLRREKYG